MSMRHKIISDYIPGNTAPLERMLADIYAGLGSLSDKFYLVGGFEAGPDSVNKALLKYTDNSDVRDAFSAIKRFFKDESSQGTKDVTSILTTRYGLSMPLANREVLSPLNKLKG